GQNPNPLWRLGEALQRRRDPACGRGRWGAGRRRFAEGGGFPGDRRRDLARRTLQFDDVALGIADVEREADAVCAVAAAFLDHLDAVRREVAADHGLVEGADLQAEMIEVAAFLTGSSSTHRPQRSVEGD